MDAQERIIHYVREHPGATVRDVTRARTRGMSRSATELLFASLVKDGKVRRRSARQGGGWEVAPE